MPTHVEGPAAPAGEVGGTFSRLFHQAVLRGILRGCCLQRDLQCHGVHCDVVSPSSIPSARDKFEVVEPRIVGSSHLKLALRPYHSAAVLEGIAFNCAPEDLGNGLIRALYRLDINRWRGKESCQLRIESILGLP